MFSPFATFLIASTIFTDWTVEQARTHSSLEQFQRAEIGGPTATKEGFVVGSPAGYLDFRSLSTGEVIWKTKLEGVSYGKWEVGEDSAFGGDSKGFIYRIRLSDGTILWKTQTKGGFFSAPLIKDDRLFIQNSLGTVFCYATADGAWIWQHTDLEAKPLSLWSPKAPVLFQGYVLSGFPNGLLKAFEASTGRQIWQEAFQSTSSQGLADALNDLKAIAANDQYLAASSYSGDLKVWKALPESKKLLWSKRVSLHSAPVLAGDKIFVSLRESRVDAYDLETGYERWQLPISGGLPSAPSLGSDGKVWIGTSTGEVMVLSQAGELLACKKSVQSPIYNSPEVLEDGSVIVKTQRAILRRLYWSPIKTEK